MAHHLELSANLVNTFPRGVVILEQTTETTADKTVLVLAAALTATYNGIDTAVNRLQYRHLRDSRTYSTADKIALLSSR